jgi:hypothetical protein
MSKESAKGFDDATHYLLDSRGEEESFRLHYNPPEGVPNCVGCAQTRVVENDCPRCQYELGFTEGASK